MEDLDVTLARLCTRYRSQFNAMEWKIFQDRFEKEEDCIVFLYQAKWPNGFSCPRCNYSHAYVIRTRRLPIYQCSNCRHQTSLTVGTIMERSRTAMSKWLSAFFLISSTDSDINAVQLREMIQVTYKTAWSMLHAIRQAISKVESEQQLSGVVKGGVGFCGQLPYCSTMLRDSQEKPIAFGASLDEHGQPTAYKMKVVSLGHMNNKFLERSGIRQFVQKYVKPEAQQGAQFYQRFALRRILPVK